MKHIAGRGGRKYDEVFIDESQDLPPSLISNLHILSNTVTCGADRSQDFQHHYETFPDDEIENILAQTEDISRTELTQNFRNTKEIFEFARRFVPEDLNVRAIDCNLLEPGDSPFIESGLNRESQLERVLDLIQSFPEYNIGVLVHVSDEVDVLRDFLKRKGYNCDGTGDPDKSFTYYHHKVLWPEKKHLENSVCTPFLACFESCKGLEFDMVVMPFFNKADWALTTQKTDQDINGRHPKFGADRQPVYYANGNTHYVAVTRARRYVYILCDDKIAAYPFF